MLTIDMQLGGAMAGRPEAPSPDAHPAGRAGDAGDGMVRPGFAAAVA